MGIHGVGRRGLARAVLSVVVLGACIVWPTSVFAAGVSWSGIQEVTPASQSSNLNDLMNVLGDPSGSTISTFQSDSGSQPGTSGFSTDTLSGGSWSSANVANGFDLGQDQPSAFAVGPNGAQATAYVVPCPASMTTTPTCVYLAWRASGTSAWGTPMLVVALPQGESTGSPAVAVDANGNATVAWLDYVNTTQSYVKAVTYDAATSGVGQVATLSGEDYIDQAPQIALDGDGTASVTWINGDYNTPTGDQVQAATRPAPTATTTDPAWSAAAALPISGNNAYTAYAFSTAQPGAGPGSVAVALCHRDASGNVTDGEIELLTHGSSGWTDSPVSTSDITSCTQDWSGLFVGRDTAGTTSVGWVEPQGPDSAGYTQYQVMEADEPSGGSWSATTDLTGGPVPYNGSNVSSQLVRPVFAEDPNGDLVAAWAQPVADSPYDQYIFADVRPAGGSFSGPQQVAEDGDSSPSVRAEVLAVSPAIDGNGDATVIWEHFVSATTPQTQDLRAVSTTAPIGSSSGPATPTQTSLSLNPSPNPSVTGQTVSITATVTPTPTPDGGTVDFTDGGTPIPGCGSVGITSGQAVCLYAFTATGTHALKAVYSGDSSYASASDTANQVVNPKPLTSTSTSLAPSAPSISGQTVTFKATVSPVPDGGTVSFEDGGTIITGCGPISVNTLTGAVSCSSSFGSPGSYTIKAVYSGDASYGGSSDTLTQVVNAAPVTPPTSPPPTTTPPTTAQITSALSAGLSVSGSDASIKYLLAHGPSANFTAPGPGQVLISWYYLPKGAVLSSARAGAAAVRPVLVARGKASAAQAGPVKVKLPLTRAGRKLLKKSRRLTLMAKGTFSPTGGSAVTVKKRTKLKP